MLKAAAAAAANGQPEVNTGPFTSLVDHGFHPFTPKSSPTKTQKHLGTATELEELIKAANRKKIKSFLRSNQWRADHGIRNKLWEEECVTVFRLRRVQGAYQDMVTDVFGQGELEHDVTLPSFVDPSTMIHYHLSTPGVHAAKRILCVLGSQCPDITFGPAIFALTCLFLHYMSEEASYSCMYGLLRSNAKYIAQTKIAFEASKFVLKDLARKYAKSWYQYASKLGLPVDGLLNHWIWWIFRDLPFSYLVRIVDCYLYEGVKVLYRAALAILMLFHKHRVKGSSGQLDVDLPVAVSQFCEEMGDIVSVEKFLRIAFGIRGLSRKQITKLTVKEEMYVTSARRIAALPQNLPTSASCESLNLKVSRSFSGPINLQNIGSTAISVDEPDSHPGLYRMRSLSHGAAAAPFSRSGSSTVTFSDWSAIWEWLPTRITLYQPELIYTTSEHGTSLVTFFNKVEGYEPTLLLLKTSKNEVIGAYCSTDWAERRQHEKTRSFFGTGESFLFTLAPKKVKYPWVGTKLGADTPAASSLFMSADSTQIAVGGGGGDALQLDENLYQGRSQHCATFDNPALTEGSDFQCMTLEVFAFK